MNTPLKDLEELYKLFQSTRATSFYPLPVFTPVREEWKHSEGLRCDVERVWVTYGWSDGTGEYVVDSVTKEE